MKLPIGSIGWLELHSGNPTESNNFYTRLFGWSSDNSTGDFTISNSGEPILTIVDSDMEGWVPYFVVASIDQFSLTAYSAGAQLILQGDAPDAKWAIMRDPQGHAFALWQCL